jgi:hypothetical protein
MSPEVPPSGSPRVVRIFVSREKGLRPLPGDYEDLEDAKYIFEKHRGDVNWCLIAEIEPGSERPNFLLHGTAGGVGVDWKYVGTE